MPTFNRQRPMAKTEVTQQIDSQDSDSLYEKSPLPFPVVCALCARPLCWVSRGGEYRYVHKPSCVQLRFGARTRVILEHALNVLAKVGRLDSSLSLERLLVENVARVTVFGAGKRWEYSLFLHPVASDRAGDHDRGYPLVTAYAPRLTARAK